MELSRRMKKMTMVTTIGMAMATTVMAEIKLENPNMDSNITFKAIDMGNEETYAISNEKGTTFVVKRSQITDNENGSYTFSDSDGTDYTFGVNGDQLYKISNSNPELPYNPIPERPDNNPTPDAPDNDHDASIDNTIPEPTPDPSNPIRDTERLDEVKANISESSSNLQSAAASYNQRLGETRSEMKGIGAQSAAMTASAVAATQQLEVGEVGVGVGHGSYADQNAQSFSLGIRPTENVNVNASWSHSDSNSDMWSAGAGYKFNVFGK